MRRGLAEFNLRVIVSRSGTVNPNAEVFQRRFSPIIILTTRRATAARLKKLRAVAAEVKICGAKEINFRRALRWLRAKWGVKRLLCEGGGELNDALFRAGLVNELHLTVCPKIFGGRAAPTIADGLGAGAWPGRPDWNSSPRGVMGTKCSSCIELRGETVNHPLSRLHAGFVSTHLAKSQSRSDSRFR